jgi:hypothetical protein
MNKYLSLAQLLNRRATAIQNPPTRSILAQAAAEVVCYLGGGERTIADIGVIPQESLVWIIRGFGYAPVRENDDLSALG